MATVTHPCAHCQNDTEVEVVNGELSTHECRVCQRGFSDDELEALAFQIIRANRRAAEAARDREENWMYRGIR